MEEFCFFMRDTRACILRWFLLKHNVHTEKCTNNKCIGRQSLTKLKHLCDQPVLYMHLCKNPGTSLHFLPSHHPLMKEGNFPYFYHHHLALHIIELCINEIIKHVFIFAWLLSLLLTFVNLFHAIGCNSLLTSIAINTTFVSMYHILFLHSILIFIRLFLALCNYE